MKEREARCLENRRLGVEERKYREAVLQEKNELEKLKRENREEWLKCQHDGNADQPKATHEEEKSPQKFTGKKMPSKPTDIDAIKDSARFRGMAYWRSIRGAGREHYMPPISSSYRNLKPSPTAQLLAKRPRLSCLACFNDNTDPESARLYRDHHPHCLPMVQ